MNGLRVNGPWDAPHHQHNARTLSSHMDAEHFQRDLSASAMYADSAATSATKNKINGVEVLSLPDSSSPANPFVSWGILRPDFALYGTWRVRFWYAHSASGQAAICTLTARSINTDTTQLGVTGAQSTSITFPAIGSALVIGKLDVTSAGFAASPERELLEWGLKRDPNAMGDGTATLYIRRVQCYFVPQRQEM